jgi:hypothetical protein
MVIMSTSQLFLVGLACALTTASLGGALYEFSVVDPAWPRRPDIVQPDRGGIDRKRFWIPAHGAFELALVASLIVAWPESDVRFWLLVALVSHGTMRIWSAFDFIPKALAFEKAEPATIAEDAARRWGRRSLLRLPLALVTCIAMFIAIVTAAALG